MNRIAFYRILFILVLVAVHQTATAQFKVYGYGTRQRGEVELVYFNDFYARSDLMKSYFGKAVDKEGLFSHSLEIEYGFTDRWTVSAYLDFEQPKDEEFEFTRFRGVFFRYRFFEKDERFINTAVYLEYYIPRKKYKNEEELEIRLILEKEFGRFKITLNPMFEKALSGPEVEEGLKFNYASGLYWNISKRVRAGLEFYGKTGELNQMGETQGDRHWIFPALKIKLPKRIGWDIGAGFGLTEYSDDLIIKNIISIVF